MSADETHKDDTRRVVDHHHKPIVVAFYVEVHPNTSNNASSEEFVLCFHEVCPIVLVQPRDTKQMMALQSLDAALKILARIFGNDPEGQFRTAASLYSLNISSVVLILAVYLYSRLNWSIFKRNRLNIAKVEGFGFCRPKTTSPIAFCSQLIELHGRPTNRMALLADAVVGAIRRRCDPTFYQIQCFSLTRKYSSKNWSTSFATSDCINPDGT